MNTVTRRDIFTAGGALLAGIAPARAADYPTRPVHIVVGYSPGGGTDFVARLVAKGLAAEWQQGAVVDNRPGGNSTVAANIVAHAAPDGYTLIATNPVHTVIPADLKLSYDPLASFAPITVAVDSQLVLVVTPALGVKTLPELIALAKSKPGVLNYGHSGIGGVNFMAPAMLVQRAGVKIVAVPFTGGGESLTALLGGEIQVLFSTPSAAGEHLKAGRLLALAVSGTERLASMPNVPTVEQAANLPGFSVTSWIGFLAPAGTPRPIIDKLRTDIIAAVKQPEIKRALVRLDYVTDGSAIVNCTPEQFADFLKVEETQQAGVMKSLTAK